MTDKAGLQDLRQHVKRFLPTPLRRWIRSRIVERYMNPARRPVRWGSLRRVAPLCPNFGYSRGLPIDRFYIERFLERCASDVTGRVLEIKDATYTRRFGGARVERADILDIDPRNSNATIVADLNKDPVPAGAFDCIVLTQTLHLIWDFRAALTTLKDGLKPGGVLLLTVPGLTPIASRTLRETWYWSFTGASMQRLLTEVFPPGSEIRVEVDGNVLSAVAFLEGMAVHELSTEELEVRDPDYQVIVAARAVRSSQ